MHNGFIIDFWCYTSFSSCVLAALDVGQEKRGRIIDFLNMSVHRSERLLVSVLTIIFVYFSNVHEAKFTADLSQKFTLHIIIAKGNLDAGGAKTSHVTSLLNCQSPSSPFPVELSAYTKAVFLSKVSALMFEHTETSTGQCACELSVAAKK